jgi:hypothetical protein
MRNGHDSLSLKIGVQESLSPPVEICTFVSRIIVALAFVYVKV